EEIDENRPAQEDRAGEKVSDTEPEEDERPVEEDLRGEKVRAIEPDVDETRIPSDDFEGENVYGAEPDPVPPSDLPEENVEDAEPSPSDDKAGEAVADHEPLPSDDKEGETVYENEAGPGEDMKGEGVESNENVREASDKPSVPREEPVADLSAVRDPELYYNAEPKQDSEKENVEPVEPEKDVPEDSEKEGIAEKEPETETEETPVESGEVEEETPPEDVEKENAVPETKPEDDIPVEAVPHTGIEKYVVTESGLKKGFYYVQIAALSDTDRIEKIIKEYGKYPFALVKAGKAYRVLVGPLTLDEYGSVLEKFKSFGYKDAFVKKIK
ncbi:MAG: SPOR domain-containing protein, partial [Treponema sp.]|nr:SPOR domain-containing protein [Treponema sp.]